MPARPSIALRDQTHTALAEGLITKGRSRGIPALLLTQIGRRGSGGCRIGSHRCISENLIVPVCRGCAIEGRPVEGDRGIGHRDIASRRGNASGVAGDCNAIQLYEGAAIGRDSPGRGARFIGREHRMLDSREVAGCGVEADGIVKYIGVYDFNGVGVGRQQIDSISPIVANHRVADEQPGAAGASHILDTLLAELRDHAVLDRDRSSRINLNADEAGGAASGTEALQLQTPENDDITGSGADIDGVGSGDQNRPQDGSAIEGDRLGDGDPAKAAWIHAVDFA